MPNHADAASPVTCPVRNDENGGLIIVGSDGCERCSRFVTAGVESRPSVREVYCHWRGQDAKAVWERVAKRSLTIGEVAPFLAMIASENPAMGVSGLEYEEQLAVEFLSNPSAEVSHDVGNVRHVDGYFYAADRVNELLSVLRAKSANF